MSYDRIRNMNYEELRNLIRPKENTKKYKEVLNELKFCCEFMNDNLKIYKNNSENNGDERFCELISEMNTIVENNLSYIKSLSEFFINN